MKFLMAELLLLATIMNGVIVGTEHLEIEYSAVDDQYLSCTDRMMGNVTGPGGLLWAELKADGSFQYSWSEAERCNTTAPGLSKYHKTALALYTSWNTSFPNTFDTDSQALGPIASVYKRYFPYKSLHFLLTDTVRILRAGQGDGCRVVHGHSREERLQGKRGQHVRLGRFFLASSRFYMDFDLTIRTCRAVAVPPLFCQSSQDSILVPPFETFQVVAVKRKPWGRRHLYLESTGTHSNLECALFSEQ